MNTIASALVAGANQPQTSDVRQRYTDLKQAIVAKYGALSPLSQAVAQLETEPYVKDYEQAVEREVLAAGAASDPALSVLAQTLLAGLPPAANSTTYHSSTKAGQIVCDFCGSEQRDNRLVCFDCGKTFVSAEEMAALQIQQPASLQTQRLTFPGAPAPKPARGVPAATVAPLPADDPVAALAIALQRMEAAAELQRQRLDQQIALLQRLASNQSQVQTVVVQDLRMDFGSMITFMLKWSVASIPALLILMIAGAIISLILGGLLAGLMR